MSNGLYFALNPGAILRRMFPNQLKTPLMIIIWAVVFILDIVAVVCVHCFVMYPISDFSRASLQEQAYFEDSKIELVESLNNYYVTYENADGEKRVARLEMFPGRIFERARIDKDYDRPAKADGSIEYVNSGNVFGSSNGMEIIVICYIVISVALLLFEFFLHEMFYRLFRR